MAISSASHPLGAVLEQQSCRFTVWAPHHDAVTLHIVAPDERFVAMERAGRALFTVIIPDVAPGTLYFYRLGQTDRPDPASRLQPRGVHGPSAVVDSAFPWTDAGFVATPLQDAVFYEVHVGTLTAAGTFDAMIERLDSLRDLGVTHVEIMPVAAFAGDRNWGYDGVYPYAVHAGYGGPDGLRRVVDACHARGLAVCLDVVYNHLGPEGNYTAQYGPYFTDRYKTPWGAALNFDGDGSDAVREYFIQSAEYLLTDFHLDAFRLDAVHAIVDETASPFLQEITARIETRARRLGRTVDVIAESDLNDVRVLRPKEAGGYAMDAQWSDDFHHAVHGVMTGEKTGYYRDFGTLSDLARAYASGYVFTGQFSSFRGRRHGNSPAGLSADRFVVCTQNHDQVGNRAAGDRLSAALSFEEQKLLACVLLLSPFVPLLFMGQEWGETAPFQFFTSFDDAELGHAVREGRRAEFAAFGWDPEDVPDPQDPSTFLRSKVGDVPSDGRGRKLWELHRELLRLRRSRPALASRDLGILSCRVDDHAGILAVDRRADGERIFSAFCFGKEASLLLPPENDGWVHLLGTEEVRFGGDEEPNETSPLGLRGAPALVTLRAHSCLVYARAP